MSFRRWPPKDPDAVKDYGFDWAKDDEGNPGLFADDALASSEWIVPDGITMDRHSFEPSGKTTIWISGGTHNSNYTFTNRVTTTGGRSDDRSAILSVKNH